MRTKRKRAMITKRLLGPDEFSPRNVKVRITTFIDQDVLRHLRVYANKKGLKYQTALNSLLRSFFDESEPASRPLSEERVRQIVKDELRRRA